MGFDLSFVEITGLLGNNNNNNKLAFCPILQERRTFVFSLNSDPITADILRETAEI